MNPKCCNSISPNLIASTLPIGRAGNSHLSPPRQRPRSIRKRHHLRYPLRSPLRDSAESLTLLVPTDAMLFDLDMRYSLPMYISTLRLHALPLRLTIFELRSLSNASSVPTFLPSHSLLITKPSSSDSVYLDGVEVYLPGLFYDQHIAVHGLANILPLSRSRWNDIENRAFALPPIVDSPSYSPSFSPSYSPSYSPSPRSTWWISPSPEDYIEFFGRTPAEPPRIGEVPVSQPPLEEDLIVGDGDSWTTGF
ncbi:hypothetical protein YC2023_019171 [Brassica napus]